MPKVCKNVNASVVNLGSLRILILIYHVFVDGIGLQLFDFVLDPSGAEHREVLTRIAVKKKLVVHQRIGRMRFCLIKRSYLAGVVSASSSPLSVGAGRTSSFDASLSFCFSTSKEIF